MTVRRIILPDPPDATDIQYAGDAGKDRLMRDICRWLATLRRNVEDYSRQQSSPAGQQLLATSYTTNTVITGTSTGTDVANFVATFVATLTGKGIVSPTVSRQSNV